MRVTVLGTGTSVGVPIVGCGCAVCTSPDPRNNRLRCSLWIVENDHHFLVDCSVDFRQQALRHRIPRVDSLLLTHSHADHINGMDDLRPYNFILKQKIEVYAAPDVMEVVRNNYYYAFEPPQTGGGVPQFVLHTLDGGALEIAGVRITPIPIFHGKLPILAFRFNDFSYVTDVSDIPEASMKLLDGTRVLIISALRYKPHPTHLSLDQACDYARRIGARQTWFTHVAHDFDHDTVNASLPPELQLAHDGLTFEL